MRDSKSSGMVVLSMARQASAAQRPAAKTISAEELANEILADVGESTTTLSMKKSQAAAAQSALLSTGSSVSQSASKLNEIKICDDKISDFLIQKSALEHQLNALEREISIVTSRRDVLRNEYVSVSSQQHDKMSRLAAAKAESERTELLDATVRSVTATYSSLDRSIRGIEDELSAIALSCNSSGTYISSAVKTDNSQTDVSTSREAFATYVFSEVACIVALTGRVADLRNKQVQKNKEILEYERIGIPALVEELRKDQDKLSSDTVEDVKTIRALQVSILKA